MHLNSGLQLGPWLYDVEKSIQGLFGVVAVEESIVIQGLFLSPYTIAFGKILTAKIEPQHL